jgi:proteic killer suppression protein
LVIVSFACAETEQIFRGQRSRRLPPNIQNVARRKLEYLHRARTLEDLRMPPGNRLEALKGNRTGHHSIRVNDQWRICFVWHSGNAKRVEIVDYH